jgi:hypothetical protein
VSNEMAKGTGHRAQGEGQRAQGKGLRHLAVVEATPSCTPIKKNAQRLRIFRTRMTLIETGYR